MDCFRHKEGHQILSAGLAKGDQCCIGSTGSSDEQDGATIAYARIKAARGQILSRQLEDASSNGMITVALGGEDLNTIEDNVLAFRRGVSLDRIGCPSPGALLGNLIELPTMTQRLNVFLLDEHADLSVMFAYAGGQSISEQVMEDIQEDPDSRSSRSKWSRASSRARSQSPNQPPSS